MMNTLQTQIAALPTLELGGWPYLSYQAVTDTVAAFLYPNGPTSAHPAPSMDAAAYQRILETADTLYGLLLDARLGRLGLDEVSRQHFKIPVTASDGVVNLLHRAVASDWPNDAKGLWHVLACAGGTDVSPRQFQPHGSGGPLEGCAQHGGLSSTLSVEEANRGRKDCFPGTDDPAWRRWARSLPAPSGGLGELDALDRRQNEAVREGLRILSAYDVPMDDGETTRLWVITEADRSVTTALLPSEY
ncbi:MAG: hypothetical protein IPJ94_10970 [Chloroflexi bacterium]|nr:hypothetical protein [Chloroflexota bacterium]